MNKDVENLSIKYNRKQLVAYANILLSSDRRINENKKKRFKRVRTGLRQSVALTNKGFKSEKWFDKKLENNGIKKFHPNEETLTKRTNEKTTMRFKYFQNYPIGPYFLDFAFPVYQVCIEVDGSYHN
jgi:hypothetical protein